MRKSLNQITLAFISIWIIPILGYLNIGLIPAIIFFIGFLGGFIFWMNARSNVNWKSIRLPYFITLLLFFIHRIDEHVSGFFEELTKITGVDYPETITIQGVLISICSLIWFLSPLFIIKGKWYGYFSAWTFFFAMGISELAHFVFPFLTTEPYGYFPGMITVIPLAPVAWWAMWRMWSVK